MIEPKTIARHLFDRALELCADLHCPEHRPGVMTQRACVCKRAETMLTELYNEALHKAIDIAESRGQAAVAAEIRRSVLS